MNYLTTIWNQLWQSHANVKQKLSILPSLGAEKELSDGQETSVKNESNQKNQKPDGKPAFTKSQLIGLLLGPGLFVLALLFFSPEGLSSRGVQCWQ